MAAKKGTLKVRNRTNQRLVLLKTDGGEQIIGNKDDEILPEGTARGPLSADPIQPIDLDALDEGSVKLVERKIASGDLQRAA